jgi:hypothetical protein
MYLAGIALAIFYLIYLPWTELSNIAATMDVLSEWLYYFALVLGLLFPLYYAIGEEERAWMVLGLGIIFASLVWLLAFPGTEAAAAITLILGLIYFLVPILEPRMGNWDMMKNVFHLIKGLLFIIAAFLYSPTLIGIGSWNHVMPHLIFLGGGLAVVFGFVLLAYGLFNLLKMFTPEGVGKFFGELAQIFYMLMTLVFLLGITYNVTSWWIVSGFGPPYPLAIEFFYNMVLLATSNLVAILLIILYIYGMFKVVEKFA